MPFKPLHNQVVIRPDKPSENLGRIIAPESARRPGHIDTGIVVSRGQGWKIYRGQRAGQYVPLDVESGDRVAYNRNSGEFHEVDGELLLLTPLEHVLGVIEAV